MEIAFKRKHEGTQTVTSGIMRLYLRNAFTKITIGGKHTMGMGQSDLTLNARLTYRSALSQRNQTPALINVARVSNSRMKTRKSIRATRFVASEYVEFSARIINFRAIS